jgi:hypothetical protein
VQSYRSLNATAKNYTYDDFISGVDLKALSFSSVFGRGLPLTTYLQDASCAKVFQEVIQTGGIVVPEVFDQLGQVSEKTALRNVSNSDGSTMKPSVPQRFYTHLHHRYICGMFSGGYRVVWMGASSPKTTLSTSSSQ